MTHAELVARAERWLRNTLHCRVVLTELRAWTRSGEEPDAIGWVGGYSILVECKTSRSDYYADRKKLARLDGMRGLGDWRFYFTPPGLLDGIVLPQGWGWYEVADRTVRHRGGERYKNARGGFWTDACCRESEIALLVSALARVQELP